MYRCFFKRFLDIIISFTALIILFPILFILTIVGIIAMRGNPFFVQKRPGKIDKKTGKEKIFPLIKFRTMSNKKGNDGELLPDADRLNVYGKALRASSLDELPEIINILLGHLSCIGPRPLLIEYIPWYTEEERHRHDVRPGLTGLAQVSGRNNVEWDRRFQLDLEYVRNISFINDIKILLLTVKKVIKRSDVSEDTGKSEGNFAEIRKKQQEQNKDEKMKNNILILSCGTRNKVVQYFKKTFYGKGLVVCADCSNFAPALYEADKYYIVPRMTTPEYLDVILDICKKEKISAVLSLIDPELSLLSKNSEKFAEIGTTVIGSSYELCEMALDKMEMYRWLSQHGYKCAKSYMDKNEFYSDVESGAITYPVFVKPSKGSASIAVSKVYDKETLELLFTHNDGLMIQEFLSGQEIGADVYIDMISGEAVSIFTKKKLAMRAGETDKAVSFKDDNLFGLIERFVKEAGYSGQIDMDIFEINGEYFISEINPRFGGGYPHAFECGCNHMELIRNNLDGIVNTKNIGKYDEGVYMMKYNEIMVKNDK